MDYRTKIQKIQGSTPIEGSGLSDCAHPLLELSDIQLDYGSLRALKDVSLSVHRGGVHAIVGEHGAGKSSLGMVISGAIAPKSGKIEFDGAVYACLTPEKARVLGIEMVHQNFDTHTYATIAESLIVNRSIFSHFPLINSKKAWRDIKSFILAHDFQLDPNSKVENLSLSDQTLIEIIKGVLQKPKFLILDEALEKLSSSVLDKVIVILNVLKKEGTTILFITHRIDDIYQFADRVTIIKNGEALLTDAVQNVDKISLMKFTYSQIGKKENVEDIDREFYQLLKYNEAILQHLPVNLIVTDGENRVKMVNEYGKRYLGVRNGSYLDVPLERVFGINNEEFLELITRALREKKENAFYNVSITLSNEKTINNVITYPIIDRAVLIGNIIIIEDITKQERLRQQVMLSEKLASVGLLAAGVAHEINNPLGIIYNYLRKLKNKAIDKAQLETLDNLAEEIDYIAHIVKNLVSFSDGSEAAKEEIELNELIRTIINLVRHNAKYKSIEISFSPDSRPLVLSANKNEIKQVLLNLLKNSFEAMPTGGSVRIKTECVRERESVHACITIEDTGPGIGEENPENIFLPFYSTKKGSGENVGLGLSVSYGIVKKYNGTIDVVNLQERGCRFTIRLPQIT